MKSILWIFVLLKFSTSEIPDRIFIELQLSNMTNKLNIQEAEVNKFLTILVNRVNISAYNLKASKFPSDFVTFLEKMKVELQKIKLDDHQIQEHPIELLSSYNYAKFRLATSLSDARYFKEIVRIIKINETQIGKFCQNVSAQYERNFKRLVPLPTKSRAITSIFRLSMMVYHQLDSYMKLLMAYVSHLNNLSSHLSFLFSNKTLTTFNFTLDDFTLKMNKIENKLIPFQQRTVFSTKPLMTKISEAEKVVARKVGASLTSKSKLSKLKLLVREVTHLFDYFFVAWPRLPDLPGTKPTIRIRSSFCDLKKRDYKLIKEGLVRNLTVITETRKELEKSMVAGSRKVQASSQELIDVIEACKMLEKILQIYIDQFDAAFYEIELVRIEFTSPCGEFELSQASNFNLLKFSGTFAAYDPVNYPNQPAERGFSAGLWRDGSVSENKKLKFEIFSIQFQHAYVG